MAYLSQATEISIPFLEAIHVTRFQFISAAATFFEESVPRMEL
jgi:hypothetical protein